ncbi:hypothetical protein LR48_Vigan10g209300 [Vigna angularis]|uniref:Uncharacterized protein n=1 Tax=Phaseolus angularis TaxID=3914 RepID=A0A0L9VMA6_PHAAN|nr:hypothetical protein LR48_Vigan10g209300 [Vigna angularis]
MIFILTSWLTSASFSLRAFTSSSGLTRKPPWSGFQLGFDFHNPNTKPHSLWIQHLPFTYKKKQGKSQPIPIHHYHRISHHPFALICILTPILIQLLSPSLSVFTHCHGHPRAPRNHRPSSSSIFSSYPPPTFDTTA